MELEIQHRPGGTTFIVSSLSSGERDAIMKLRWSWYRVTRDNQDRKAPLRWRIDAPFAGDHHIARRSLARIGGSANGTSMLTEIGRLEQAMAPYYLKADGLDARLSVLADRQAGRGRPFMPHQLSGIRYLGRLRGGLLMDEMGLGKAYTSAGLSGALDLFPILFVTRNRIRDDLLTELRRVFTPSQIIDVENEASIANPGPNPVYLVHYEILHRITSIAENPLGLVAFDESQELQNDGTIRAEAARTLAFASARVLLVSGTPMANRPADLFFQLHLIRHPIAREWFKYAKRYCGGQRKEFTDSQDKSKRRSIFMTDGVTNSEEFSELISPFMIRRTKAEVGNIPPKHEWDNEIELSPSEVYWQLERTWKKEKRAKPGSLLKNIINMLAALAVAKVPHTVDELGRMLERHEKVVVFTAVIKAGDILQKSIPGALRLEGNQSRKQALEIRARFDKDPKCRVMIAAEKAVCAGVNLQVASGLIRNDTGWKGDTYLQIRDRIHRIGSKHPCEMVRMVAKWTFDEVLRLAVDGKVDLAEAMAKWIQVDTAHALKAPAAGKELALT